jgi:hypothetical protein
MAVLTNSAILSKISGKLGGDYFSHIKNRTILSKLSFHSQRQSIYTSTQKRYFSLVANFWKNQSYANFQKWTALVSENPNTFYGNKGELLTPRELMFFYNYYLSTCNASPVIVALPYTPISFLPMVTFTHDIGADTYIISPNGATVPANEFYLFFASKDFANSNIPKNEPLKYIGCIPPGGDADVDVTTAYKALFPSPGINPYFKIKIVAISESTSVGYYIVNSIGNYNS